MDRPITQELKQDNPGFYPRGVRPCSMFNMGYRCTRQIYHEGPHASHILRGIEGTTKLVPIDGKNPEGEMQIVPREPGMRTEEWIQVATWLGGEQ